MKKIGWGSPAATGNPAFMGLAWAMAAQKLIIESNMKKYFPIQYRMMKNLEKQLEGLAK